MDIAALAELNAARHERRAAILLTDIAGGAGRVILESHGETGELGDIVERAFRSGRSGLYALEGGEVFLNVHVPAPRIAVIGAVHISQALAGIAAIAGYDLRVIDPRTAFATPERFAGIDLAAEWPQDELAKRPLDAFTALVAVTHDPKIDDFPIAQALRTGCFYVGALGSRKTHAKRVDRLEAEGLSAAQIARIHAPIGLDIAAANPMEIAVAIMAEVIDAYRRRPIGAPASAAEAQAAGA
ncbi:MAG: XdhC family protein [Nitratireductor sp.]|nr:XdhC family protein [Nitratireductor sp.]